MNDEPINDTILHPFFLFVFFFCLSSGRLRYVWSSRVNRDAAAGPLLPNRRKQQCGARNKTMHMLLFCFCQVQQLLLLWLLLLRLTAAVSSFSSCSSCCFCVVASKAQRPLPKAAAAELLRLAAAALGQRCGGAAAGCSIAAGVVG